jgi:hypothetical protein
MVSFPLPNISKLKNQAISSMDSSLISSLDSTAHSLIQHATAASTKNGVNSAWRK